MAERLPPLNALRAFEAAARHLSFVKAAKELHVTPGAISQQVKALEDYLGIQLFRRLHKGLRLTEAAQSCLPTLQEGFERLAETIRRLRVRDRVLTVSVAPSIAAKWLVPRLDRFRDVHPGIDVRIDASQRVVDLARDDVDIGIRYGRGNYPGLRTDRLFTEQEAFPVCSPRLLAGPQPLRCPDDLRSHTLLHIVDHTAQTDTWPDWRMWLQAAGVHDIDATRGLQLSASSLLVQAAIEGQGVALVGSVLVADDLAAGRLVRPFELSLSVNFACYVVSLEATADQPSIAAFREWLIEASIESAAAT